MVYFMRAEGLHYIKIGSCEDAQIHQRRRSLQTGCPTRLKIVAAIPGGADVERSLHREFAVHRSHGEWFEMAPGIASRMAMAYADHGDWWKRIPEQADAKPKTDRTAAAIDWLTERFRERRQWDAAEIRGMAKQSGISTRQLWSPGVQGLPIRKRQINGPGGDRQWVWVADTGWPMNH